MPRRHTRAERRRLSPGRNVGLVITGSGSSLAAFPLAAMAWGGQSWQWAWAMGAAAALLWGAVGVARLCVASAGVSSGGGSVLSRTPATSRSRPGFGTRADRLGPTALAGWAAALGLAGLALGALSALTGTRPVTWWTCSAFLVAVALALALVVIDEMASGR